MRVVRCYFVAAQADVGVGAERGDFQQAAVEFMVGYQNYPKTNKGPDNLLKLGMSMAKLNQTQGACTALSRIAKDYPDAPDTVLGSAKTERARLKCK